ncbi:hypothetical protein M9Y10_025623 [Tritrichomonas musculus]|uniref:F5/8 type C domain-containing protein n=1 Tax=Tritrichomonas musculus TaxID=1915356 RepID=A0ABR2H987_9EUKA
MNSTAISNFALSIESIKEIPFEKYDNDFTFVVNGKEYKTSRFFADFISPRIRQAHFVDKTINKYCFNTIAKTTKIDFSSILSLITFQPTNLNQREVDYFIDIFSALGNKRELLKLIPQYNEEITTQNVFNRINKKQKYLQRFNSARYPNEQESEKYDEEASLLMIENQQINSEIDFVSTHFYELDIEKVKKIDSTILEEIIKSDKLMLKDEDILIRMIIDLYSKDHKLAYFFKYVNFLNVSNEELQHFSRIFDLTDIDGQIWSSIIERTLKSNVFDNVLKNEKKNQRYNYNNINTPIELLHIGNSDFKGIIKYLTDKTLGNIHDNGTIEVTSNSYVNEREPKYLLDYNYNHSYKPKQTDAWVCFNFKNKKVKLTNYSIRSNINGQNGHHLKSWVIETSNDGKVWNQIDQRVNCPTLNGSLAVGTFDVKDNDYSQYVRIHQTDKPWGGDALFFYYIEFYGYLIEQQNE